MGLFSRQLVGLVAATALNAQSESDVMMIRSLQWFQSIQQTPVPLAAHSKASVTIAVEPDPQGGDQIAGAVENQAIRVSLVLPDGRKIDEKDSGKYGIRVERKHKTASHTLTILPELFPDLDVVSFTLPAKSIAGEYRIAGDASKFSTDSTLIGAFMPGFREESRLDDVSITATLDMYKEARGCPNIAAKVEVTALCGNVACSSLNVSAVSTRKDGVGKDIHALPAHAEPSKTNPWQDLVFGSASFPEFPAGDYVIITTVQAKSKAGRTFVQQKRTGLTVPPAQATIGNFRALPPVKHPDGGFQSMEVAVDVQVDAPGTYEIRLDLCPEAGGHVVTVTSSSEFPDKNRREMRIKISEEDVLDLGNTGPYLVQHPRLYFLRQSEPRAVCVAHRADGGKLPAPF